MIKNRRTVNINQSFLNPSSFTRQITLGFEPDDVIVKQVTYRAVLGDQEAVYYVRTNMIKDSASNLLCSFVPKMMISENTYFNSETNEVVDAVLQGDYSVTTPCATFQVEQSNVNSGSTEFTIVETTLNPIGQFVDASNALTGELSLQLEFVQYQK
jgi:hypothetical protein